MHRQTHRTNEALASTLSYFWQLRDLPSVLIRSAAGLSPKGASGFYTDWTQQQWDDAWAVRECLCNNHWDNSGSCQSGSARGQTNIQLGQGCAQQSCWNNLWNVIFECMDTAHGKHSNGGQVNDYNNDCWYYLQIDEPYKG